MEQKLVFKIKMIKTTSDKHMENAERKSPINSPQRNTVFCTFKFIQFLPLYVPQETSFQRNDRNLGIKKA